MKHHKLPPLILAFALALGAPGVFAAEKPAPDSNTATVTVRADPSARRIPEGFVGLSYEKRELSTTQIFTASNTALVKLFKDLGPGTLRIGGSSVDGCEWDAAGPGAVPEKISPSDLDRLTDFLKATGWKAIYGINLVKNTPEDAAEEAAAAARILGEGLMGYEIGNEPDLHAGHCRPVNYGYKEFLAEWTTYANTIAKAVPGAVFTGPSTSWKMSFVLPMAKDAKGRLAQVTNHYYIGGPTGPECSIEGMLTLPDAKRLLPTLVAMRKAAEENRLPLGYRFSEIASYYSGGKQGVSDTYASALWTADTLFTCAEYGAAGINFHTRNEAPYTSILHDYSSTAILAVRPGFYGIRFFAEAAHGAPMVTTEKTTGAGRPLRAHAVADKGGLIRIALINVNASGDCAADLTLPADIRRAESTLALTGPVLEAKDGVLLGGSPIGVDASWNPKPAQPLRTEGRQLRVVVPAASALLITATTDLPDAAESKHSR